MADAVEDRVEVWRGGEAEGAFAEVFGGEDFGFEERRCVVRYGLVVEEEALAGLYLAAGADEGGPGVGLGLLGEEDFDAAGGVG